MLIILQLQFVQSCSTQVAIKSSAESATAVALQHCSTLHDPAMARLITEITTTTSHNSSFVAVVRCGGGGGYIIIAPRSSCHLLLGLDC